MISVVVGSLTGGGEGEGGEIVESSGKRFSSSRRGVSTSCGFADGSAGSTRSTETMTGGEGGGDGGSGGKSSGSGSPETDSKHMSSSLPISFSGPIKTESNG